MNSNTKGFIFIVILVAAIVGGMIFISNRQKDNSVSSSGSDPNSAPVTQADNLNPDNRDATYIDNLAKFMTAQGMTMYGATWCPHCQAQRAVFGDAEKDVKIIECSTDPKKTDQAPECNVSYFDVAKGQNFTNIQGYPTWIYQGKGYSGEQTITELAKIVGYVDNSAATTP